MLESKIDRVGSAKLTIYPDTKHDAWTATYQNLEVFEWLLSHCRYSEGAKSDNSYADAKKFG
jgi:hypothetical protein